MEDRRPLTEQLATHCADVARSPLREKTAGAVRRALFDAVVCALVGTATEEMAALYNGLGLPPVPTGQLLPPAGDRATSVASAALFNGACAHALELDDTHSFSSVHGAGPVVLAVLTFLAAPAARGQYGSADVARAVTAGYESACRLGGACRGSTSPYARGFHPTGVHGVYGATAAIGALLEFDAETMAGAFGVAGSLASGLMACVVDGSWTKKLHAGWAAHGGIVAAKLAAAGFRGPRMVLEGPFGFVEAHCEQPDLDYLFADLAQRREVRRLSFKLFPCCRSIHPAITATLAALEGYEGSHEQIASIHLTIANEDVDLVAEPREAKIHPTAPEEARFSLYWGTAVAAARRRAAPDDFADPALRDPALRRLAASVTYDVDAQMTAVRPEYFPCEARVTLRDGRRLVARVEAPRGDYRNPVDDHGLLEKAQRLLEDAPLQAEALFERVWALETADDVDALLEMIFHRSESIS